MDKIKLLIDLFVLVITVDVINGDSQCDCSSLMDGQEFIKAELLQIKFDNFKIKSRLRRLEASKLHSTRPNDGIVNKESDRQSTHVDRKEETHDNDRIDTMEAKLAGIASLLKINDVNGTDVQGTMQSQLLDKIDAKLLSVSYQINDTIEKKDANKAVLGNLVKRTLLSEKRIRMKFEATLRKSMEHIKTSFNEFKRESVKMMANQSDTLDRKLEQSRVIVNELSENINQKINEEIHAIDRSLYNLTEKLSDTKAGLSSLRDVTINNKIDGGWSRWESWGSCSESCGGGVQNRIRTCSNPRPSLSGTFCDGSPEQTRTCNKHQCKEFNAAFTAYNRKYYDSPSYSPIVFQLTYINNGNAYDTRTGKFTCKIPGVYYFSVTLTKQYMNISFVDAYIRINGVEKLAMYWYPYEDDKHGYDGTPLTQSGTFHLNKNDVVYIYGKPNEFYDGYSSSFTGYLISPD